MRQPAEMPRAIRYEMSPPILYRSAGTRDWQSGRMVNVSRSGVLLEASLPALPAATRIEFVFVLPSPGFAGSSALQCQGRVARTINGRADGSGAMAATIDAYEFLLVAPARVPDRVRP
jgi:hypothetical protein